MWGSHFVGIRHSQSWAVVSYTPMGEPMGCAWSGVQGAALSKLLKRMRSAMGCPEWLVWSVVIQQPRWNQGIA